MENKMKNILSPAYYLRLKNIILLLNWGLIFFFFFFFKSSYSQRCFNVVQRCENLSWKWQRCFDVVQINVEMYNVDSTLFNVDVHSIVSMLIWRWNNVETTFKCLLGYNLGFSYQPSSLPNNITRQYQRSIKNPVELRRWSSFTKIVNG